MPTAAVAGDRTQQKAGETPVDTFAVESNFTVKTLDCCDISGFDGHELVLSGADPSNGLRAFIAIHSTALGPALGGCRMWPYDSEEEALTDALRLSQGMSYKHAVAGTHQGGGKAVIMGDPRQDKSEALFCAFGRFVDRLGGQYITAEDVGVSAEEMVTVGKRTKHVAGLPVSKGGSGDPSPVTAYGVFCGIQAAVAFKQQRPYDPRNRLDGLTVAIQGLGNVGSSLCHRLHAAGAKLIVTDIHETNIRRVCDAFSAAAVDPDSIYDAAADVFAPCALGGTINAYSVSRLQATIVAGAANNQLADSAVVSALAQRNILYAPDYVINAGGIINISYEKQGYDRQLALRHTERIGVTLTDIFKRACQEKTTTAEVADAMARHRLCQSSASERPGSANRGRLTR